MNYFQLSNREKNDIFAITERKIFRPPALLEKDIWVVWSLNTLFNNKINERLSFKGGTSLSKAGNIINRVSEDIDVAYDNRQIPEFVIDPANPYPRNRSQTAKWIKISKHHLAEWINETLIPVFETRIFDENIPATIWQDKQEQHKVYIEYESVVKGLPYVQRRVFLEFGARSTGEPAGTYKIQSDIQDIIKGIEFPSAKVEVVKFERTFWEKLLAAHTYCLRGKARGGERYSRHWFDLHCLHQKGISNEALKDIDLACRAVKSQETYYRERDSTGEWIDYNKAIKGELCLVPEKESYENLKNDYVKMTDSGYILGGHISFDKLMINIREMEDYINTKMSKDISENTPEP